MSFRSHFFVPHATTFAHGTTPAPPKHCCRPPLCLSPRRTEYVGAHNPAVTPLTATHRSSASTRQPIRLAPARPSRRTVCPSRPRSRLRSCVFLRPKYHRFADCVVVPELPPRDHQHQQSAARGARRQPQQRLAKGEVLAQRLQMSVAPRKRHGLDICTLVDCAGMTRPAAHDVWCRAGHGVCRL
jgi:hypothetical protein